MVLQFEKGTFGEPLSKAAKDKYISELYGNRTSGQPLLLESSLLLDLPEEQPKLGPTQAIPKAIPPSTLAPVSSRPLQTAGSSLSLPPQQGSKSTQVRAGIVSSCFWPDKLEPQQD